MGAPSKAHIIQLVTHNGWQNMRQLSLFEEAKWEVQSRERLATIPEVNPAPDGVTCHGEARGWDTGPQRK